MISFTSTCYRYIKATKKRAVRLAPSTIRNYTYFLKRLADDVYKSASQFTHADLRIFLNKFTHLKESSIENKIYILKSFFGWLHDEEIIPSNPARKLIIPKKPIRNRDGLTVEQLEMVRNACENARERAVVEVYLASGCRLSELVGAKLSSIKNNSIRVIGKGNKERIVFLNEKAMMYLKLYVNSRRDDCDILFTGERISRKTKQYGAIKGAAIEKLLNKIGARAGVHIYPHIFRHTFATMMIKNGASMRVVQELLGHADPKTTNIYAHMSVGSLQMEYNRCSVA